MLTQSTVAAGTRGGEASCVSHVCLHRASWQQGLTEGGQRGQAGSREKGTDLHQGRKRAERAVLMGERLGKLQPPKTYSK